MGNVFQRPKRFGTSLHVYSVRDAVRALEENREKNLRVNLSHGIKDITPIAKALETNTSVKILYLSKNKLVDVTSLGNALRQNQSLLKLDVHGNEISDADSIFEALVYNNTIQELYLHQNAISDISKLSSALQTNHSLQELHLQKNNISCVDGLGEGIKHNKKLRCLRLQQNFISDVTILSDGIAHNSSLRDLRLSGNIINNETVISLGGCLQKNQSLRRLELYGNAIDLPKSVWQVRPWRLCGPVIDVCATLETLKEMRRDYLSFAATVGFNTCKGVTIQFVNNSNGSYVGLKDLDKLVLSNIAEFLWHSKSIESRLCILAQSLTNSHNSSVDEFNFLEWLLQKKSELEVEPETQMKTAVKRGL
jgi:hypothetical protein